LIPLFFSLDRDHVANVFSETRAMNGIRRSQITAENRINEIAEILAIGLLRLRARQSTPVSPHYGESALDCVGVQSGPADDLTSEGGSR
jgi:hypothetical protein